MQDCNLPHIPKRLHTNQRPESQVFYIDEELYWRVERKTGDSEDNTLPYATISLKDVSHNRQGNPVSAISEAEDVLYNIDPQINLERIDKDVLILKIKELNEDNIYCKEIFVNGRPEKVVVKLIHDPLPCNYAHVVFRYWLDESVITDENYDNTLGKKTYKNFRKACRDELAAMIFKRELWINFNFKEN